VTLSSVNTFESYDDFLNRLNNTLEQSHHRIKTPGTHRNLYNNYHHHHRQQNGHHNSEQAHQPDGPTQYRYTNSNSKQAVNYQPADNGYNQASYANDGIVISNLNTSPQSFRSTPVTVDKKQQHSGGGVTPLTQQQKHNFLNQNYRSPSISKEGSFKQQQLQFQQDEQLRARLRTAINSIRSNSKLNGTTNPGDVYHDKITDQKFFNRNFKVKPVSSAAGQSTNASPGDLSNSNSDTPATNNQSNSNNNNEMSLTYTSTRMLSGGAAPSNHQNSNSATTAANGQTYHNHHQQHNQVDLNNNSIMINQPQQSQQYPSTSNKLKLLKKRNALKKTLSSLAKSAASSTNGGNESATLPHNSSSSGAVVMKNMTNTPAYLANSTNALAAKSRSAHFESRSREDLSKSHNNLNQSSSRPLSVHFSRNSLMNQTDGGGNSFRKSIETLGDHDGVAEHEELTNLKFSSFNGNLSRVRSTPHINATTNGANQATFTLPSSTQKVFRLKF
jgi:hypothetical protein